MSLIKLWQYSLGSYSDDKTKPYDKQMLIIRTIWVLLHIVTCMAIILNAIASHGWGLIGL